MKSRERTKNPTKHWSAQQDLWYYFSLILNADVLLKNPNNGKKVRIFKLMSKWIGRSNVQCRTHHQKKLSRLKESQRKGRLEIGTIYQFYYENFKIRRLDQDRLRLQLDNFLHQVLKLQPEEIDEYKLKIQQNLEELQLEKNCHLYLLDGTSSAHVDSESLDQSSNAPVNSDLQRCQPIDKESSDLAQTGNTESNSLPPIVDAQAHYRLLFYRQGDSQIYFSDQSDNVFDWPENHHVYDQ